MANHYIPFANSAGDWPLIGTLYSGAAGCRVTLQSLQNAGSQPLPKCKLWVDAGVDGLHSPTVAAPEYKINPRYKAYIQKFAGYHRIADPQFQRSPDKATAAAFVKSVLDAAHAVAGSSWLSVPQLPYSSGTDRNRINRLLAEAAWEWRYAVRCREKLILPVILAELGQTDKKTDRNPKVDLASACLESSGADGVWVVDSLLNDQDGMKDFENVRFRGLVSFHEELNSKIPNDTVTVAGPYWGLNVILWARGLIKLPAIGLGKSYQYHVAGGMQKEGLSRVALSPLRRLAQWSPALRKWLEDSLRSLPKSDPAHIEFEKIHRGFESLQNKDVSRRQTARFYNEWLGKIEAVPATSRALSLYQDFSAAYVLGKGLRPLPAPEKVKDPARIAKQFMVNCL
jgi:hypothetical protein